jgi:hypothetical protein
LATRNSAAAPMIGPDDLRHHVGSGLQPGDAAADRRAE